MRLDFKVQFLEVLNDGALDRLAQVGMMVSDDAGLVADVVVDVLKTVLAKELIPSFEWDLNYRSELGEFLGGVVLDVGDAFKVANQLLRDSLPGRESVRVRCAAKMAPWPSLES